MAEITMDEPSEPAAEEWAIVELMGHRTRCGRVSEVERFGAKLLMVEAVAFDAEGAMTTRVEYYSGAAIYCLSPTTKDECLRRAPRAYRPLQLSAFEPEDEDEAELNFEADAHD